MAKTLNLTLLLGVLLAACQPAPVQLTPNASRTLPPPSLMRTQAARLSAASPTPPPPTHQPETPFPQNLSELAFALYGERVPQRLAIPALDLQAPVVPVGWNGRDATDLPDLRWDSPAASVGWVIDSGLPGAASGNVLLYGHNNIHSSVFRDLYTLEPGAQVILSTQQADWRYIIDSVQIIPVDSTPEDALLYTAALKDSLTPRLTVISCYPPEGNTHRVLVTAFPTR